MCLLPYLVIWANIEFPYVMDYITIYTVTYCCECSMIFLCNLHLLVVLQLWHFSMLFQSECMLIIDMIVATAHHKSRLLFYIPLFVSFRFPSFQVFLSMIHWNYLTVPYSRIIFCYRYTNHLYILKHDHFTKFQGVSILKVS